MLRAISFSKYRLLLTAIVLGLVGTCFLIRSFATPNPNLPGDLNSDQVVNITDLSILLSHYGTTDATADINSDGAVNVFDLSALLSNYGKTYTPPTTATSWLNGWGSYTSLGQKWPGSDWRSFSDNSPFNTPIPTSPRLVANSNAISSTLIGFGPMEKFVAQLNGHSGEPTYYSVSGDPVFRIHCTRPWGTCGLEGKSIHIPAGAVVEGGVAASINSTDTSGDAHMAVIDQTAGYEYDMWQVQISPIPATGGNLNISWGGLSAMSGPGVGTGGATASNYANSMGRIRAEEMAAGHIDHALFLTAYCDSGTFVYPAIQAGSSCTGISNAPPMGSRFQLTLSSSEIDGLAIPTWQKTILHAFAKYGAFMGDTGNTWTFETESGDMYTTMGGADRWLNFATSNGWDYWAGDSQYPPAYIGDMRNALDSKGGWATNLRVIDPCVSQKTCQ
jgi:hypothetical protein